MVDGQARRDAGADRRPALTSGALRSVVRSSGDGQASAGGELDVTVDEVRFVRSTFGLGQRGLARVLALSPATVARWEAGESAPAGLQVEVMRALHCVALSVAGDERRRSEIAGAIALGVGSLIVRLLTGPAGLPVSAQQEVRCQRPR